MTALFIGLVVLAWLLSLGFVFTRGYRRGMAFGVLAARDEIRSKTEVAEHCQQQWVDWEQKAESYRSLNAGILDERDKWQHMYQEQSAAHGNAQAIMMGAIDYMGRKLDAAGVKFQIPAILEEVRAQFIHNHVTPMLRDAASTVHQQPALSQEVQQKTSEVG
jgi:hypothetical protein